MNAAKYGTIHRMRDQLDSPCTLGQSCRAAHHVVGARWNHRAAMCFTSVSFHLLRVSDGLVS